MQGTRKLAVFLALGLVLSLAACQPTLRIEPPEKPIVINLNIKVEQEVRIRVERDAEELIKRNPELF